MRLSVLLGFLCVFLGALRAGAAGLQLQPMLADVALAAAGAAPHEGGAKGTEAPAKNAEKADVRFGERVLFTFLGPLGEQTAAERARAASQAFKETFEREQSSEVHVTAQGERLVLFLGDSAFAIFSQADADLAHAVSLDAHAKNIAAICQQALTAELKRKSIANTVLSFSLVVFLALVALYLLRTVSDLGKRLRTGFAKMPDRKLSFQVRGIEVLSPSMWRKLGELLLAIAPWAAQVSIGYTWLLVVLSLFEATQGYTQRLTVFVLSPLVQLTEAFASTVPLLVLLVFAGVALLVLVRFIKLFFLSVARGETVLRGVSADLALPISVVLRVALVIGALVFAAPVVTGSSDGPIGRVGMLALVTMCLATTPVLASALVGAFVIFGRRLKLRDYAQIGAHFGQIENLGLIEIQLRSPTGTLLRIPHLKTLWTPVEIFGPTLRLTFDLPLSATTSAAVALQTLTQAAQELDTDAQVSLLAADAEALRYRVSLVGNWAERSVIHMQLLDRLARANIKLGRSTP